MRCIAHRRWPIAGTSVLAVIVAWAFQPAAAMTLMIDQAFSSRVAESAGAALVRVSQVRYGFDERGLHSTFLTLRIEDAIYGSVRPESGRPLTLKLYGAPAPLADGSRVFVDGTPRYRPGERYVLLLTEESEWGFSSTVGLSQGAYRISERADGTLLAYPTAAGRSAAGREEPIAGLAERLEYRTLRDSLLRQWEALGRPAPVGMDGDHR